MKNKLTWKDVEDIAEILNESHPDFDVMSLRFTTLKKMVLSLPQFGDDTGNCNEKVLEAIQVSWMEEQKYGKSSR